MNNSLLSFLIFLGITIAYTIALYFLYTNEKIITGIYFIVVLIIQFTIGLFQSKQLCGEVQSLNVLKSVLIPWTLIFGSMIIVLEVFPIIKQPFANTFGYMVARLRDVNTVFLSMMKGKGQGIDDILTTIYKDQSLLVNTFTPWNFDDAMNALDHLWNKQPIDERTGKPSIKAFEENKSRLRSIVQSKYEISRILLYLFTGFFTTSITSMGLSSVECEKSPQYIQQEYSKISSLV